MTNQQSLGLVVEGNATSSLILRLPGIAQELGPVKAGALRVARRVSNFLHAGYAIPTYEDLQPSRLVFMRVPDGTAPRIVEELCASELQLKNMSFVLIETCLSTSALKPLQARGALTATVMAVQSLRKSWYIVEGQGSAVRQVRKFLDRSDARSFELRPGTKPLYFAAQLLATAFPVQLFVQAQHALRSAGITGNHLHELLEEMSSEMFRSFANGVKLSWPSARTGCPESTSVEYFRYLHEHAPELASVLDELLRLAGHPTPGSFDSTGVSAQSLHTVRTSVTNDQLAN